MRFLTFSGPCGAKLMMVEFWMFQDLASDSWF